jgi:CRISPR-associated endonuclease Cas3-HD
VSHDTTGSEARVPHARLQHWAKTGRDPIDRTTIVEWLPLHQHLTDTAGVARRLIDEWVSPQVVRRIARDLRGGHEDVRTVATWLAAVHDVGKLGPAFVVQAPELADAMRIHGLAADQRLALDTDRAKARHEIVGQLAVREWLQAELGFDKRGAAAQLACVVGGHHGERPRGAPWRWSRARATCRGTRPGGEPGTQPWRGRPIGSDATPSLASPTPGWGSRRRPCLPQS